MPDVAAGPATAGHQHQPRRAGPVEPLVHGRALLRDLLDVHDAVGVLAAVGGRHREGAADAHVAELGELPYAGEPAVDVGGHDGRAGGIGGRGTVLVPPGAVGV